MTNSGEYVTTQKVKLSRLKIGKFGMLKEDYNTSASISQDADWKRTSKAKPIPSITQVTEKHISWAYAAVAISVFSWAAAFPAITFSLTELKPVTLATARFGIAAAFALGWLLWRRKPLPALPHMVRFAACGLLGLTLYSVLINMGQKTVSASAASFITNIIPIVTALLAWSMLGERFSLLGWAGCLISFAGVSYIGLGQPGGLSFGSGASFILMASLSSALYFVLQKPLVPIYGAAYSTGYTLVFAGLFLLPWMPASTAEVINASFGTMIALAGLTLFPTLIAYLTWTYALGRLPASVAANFIYLIAPLAALLAFLFLNEQPSGSTLIGGSIAIVGTVIVARWGRSAVRENP